MDERVGGLRIGEFEGVMRSDEAGLLFALNELVVIASASFTRDYDLSVDRISNALVGWGLVCLFYACFRQKILYDSQRPWFRGKSRRSSEEGESVEYRGALLMSDGTFRSGGTRNSVSTAKSLFVLRI